MAKQEAVEKKLFDTIELKMANTLSFARLEHDRDNFKDKGKFMEMDKTEESLAELSEGLAELKEQIRQLHEDYRALSQ